MNCRGAQFKLAAYLDGELAGTEMLEFRSHLNSCSECAEDARQMRGLKSILNNLPEAEPDAAFSARLKEIVFTAQPRPAAQRGWSFAMISGFAVATAFFVGLAFVQQQHHVPISTVVASQPTPIRQQGNLDLERDQAYQSARDPFNDGSMVLTMSDGVNGSRN